MINWRTTCELLNITVNRYQADSMDELEKRGLYFCVEFGTENACDILEDKNQRQRPAPTRLIEKPGTGSP